MPRRLLWSAAALVIMAPVACYAQIAPNPAARTPLLLVQMDINGGRLQARPRHQGRTTSSFTRTNNERNERVTVRLNGNEPRIEYNVATPTQRVSIVVSSSFDFYVRQEPLGNASTILPLSFTQPPSGDLSLSWEAAGSPHQVEAPSLWHLWMAEPEICRQHLLPLLELLRPDWRLTETADKIAEALLVSSTRQRQPPWQHWHALVTDLGADEYAIRRASDRQLRSAGPAVRSFLENYDRRKLDAEQRHRLRAILRLLAGRSDSTSPEAIASWLATDPRVWLAMLSNTDPKRRQLAKDQLARLLEQPIEFDPTAEAPVRQDQIEMLRRQVLEGLEQTAKDDADRS